MRPHGADTHLLESAPRPLTESERRLLRGRIRSLLARGRRARTISIPITGGVVSVLWVLTILASDAPWTVITGFWVVVGAAIAVWVRRDMRKDEGNLREMAASLQSALTRNAADVYDIRARAFAEFEEVEDEGACYAFDLRDNRVVFISGQEFYESSKFPSLDFSLVYVLNEAGQTVDLMIDKRGAKAAPARTIPGAVKERLELPEHLEVRPGTIENLEEILGVSPSSREG